MAKIRPVLANPNLQGGSVGPRADAASMGSASAQRIGDIAQGLDSLSSGVAAYDRTRQQIDNHLKDVNDTIAINNSTVYLRKASTDYLTNPDNQKADDFHKSYESFMSDALEQAKKGLSTEAGVHVQDAWGTIYSSGYAHAAQTVVSRQMEQAGVSISDNLTSELTAIVTGSNEFRPTIDTKGGQALAPGSTDWLVAATDQAINKAVSQSDKVYGSLMPNRNQMVKENAVKGAVVRLIERDPEAARAVLFNHTNQVDPILHSNLIKAIDRAVDQKRSEQVVSFHELTEQTLFSAYAGKGPGDNYVNSSLSRSRFQEIYGSEQGGVRYEAFKAEYDAATEANTVYDQIRGLNPAEQNAFAEQFLAKNSNDRHKARAVQMFENRLESNQKLLAKDPVHWMVSNNDSVSSALGELTAIRETGSPEQVTAAHQKYLDRIIQYQGAAPESASPEDRARYLNLSRPSVLTKAQLAEWTKQLSAASTDEFINLTSQVAQSYPTTEKLNYFLSDLMSVKESAGTDLKFQVFLQNRSNPNLAAIIESTRESQDEKKLDGKIVQGLTSAMATYVEPAMLSVRTGLGESRTGSVVAMRDVIENYARRLALRSGMSPDKAAQTAYDQVFKHTLYLGQVNGAPAVLPKEVDGIRFDDKVMPDLALAADRAIQLFDGSSVDLKSFPLASSFLPDDLMKKEEVERQVRLRGRVSVSADGKNLQLLVIDDMGKPFLLRDKTGHPYQVDIAEDLANFAQNTMETVAFEPSATDIGDLGSAPPLTPRTMKRRVQSTQWKSSSAPLDVKTYWPLRKE